MKKILLILPLLIIAGAAAWWFLLRAPAAEGAATATAPAAAEVKYIELKPLVVPVVREGAVEKIVRVDVALELQDSGAAPKVNESLPRLTDAFVIELYSLLGHRLMEAERYDPGISSAACRLPAPACSGPASSPTS
jgi:flagellar basal body-associated protein FliL